MKIVLACDTFDPDVNGAAVFAERLAAGLIQRGHELHIIAPSPKGYSYQHGCGEARVHRLPSFRYPWHPTFHIADFRRASHGVDRVLRDIQPDIVHVQSHFVVGRAAAKASSRLGIPWIATNHFMPENLRSQLPIGIPEFVYRGLAALAWRDAARVLDGASAVTAPTNRAVEILRQRAGIQNALSISCGIDTTAFAATRRPATSRSIVLFVGRLEVEKHVDQLIRAIPLMTWPAQVRIVGTGTQERSLRKLASKLGVDDTVHFLGYLSNDELISELNYASIFCMPGTAELQSIATLEAMAAGLPVVAADAHALPELVLRETNGELFPPGDVACLALLLDRILSDPQRRTTYGQLSRQLALRHELSGTIDQFEGLYLKASVV